MKKCYGDLLAEVQEWVSRVREENRRWEAKDTEVHVEAGKINSAEPVKWRRRRRRQE